MDAFVNRYDWRDIAYVPAAAFSIAGGTRATGTFSYISGMSGFSSPCLKTLSHRNVWA
jgi:hypothetical protein